MSETRDPATDRPHGQETPAPRPRRGRAGSRPYSMAVTTKQFPVHGRRDAPDPRAAASRAGATS